jgi:hypothetical protein
MTPPWATMRAWMTLRDMGMLRLYRWMPVPTISTAHRPTAVHVHVPGR